MCVVNAGKPSFSSPRSSQVFRGQDQQLVKLGYGIASPRTATFEGELASPAGITPPPPYTFRPSSQPVRSIEREQETPKHGACCRCATRWKTPALVNGKRKRSEDRTPTQRRTGPSTPGHTAAEATPNPRGNGRVEIADCDADDEDDELIEAPPRKRLRTVGGSRRRNPPKSNTPPKYMKTKKGALVSTISAEAAADFGVTVSAAAEHLLVQSEEDADVLEEERPMQVDGCGETMVPGLTRPATPNEMVAEEDGEEETAQIQERGQMAQQDHELPPWSTPEEACAQLLLAFRNPAPTTSMSELVVDDGTHALFVRETETLNATPPRSDAAVLARREVPPQTQGAAASHALDQSIALTPAGGNVEAAGISTWSAAERRLYRHFCEDVRKAEVQYTEHATWQAMVKLRKTEPELQATFLKCLAIARKTLGEGVVDEWRQFLEQGRARRVQHKGSYLDTEGVITGSNGSPTELNPTQQGIVAQAYYHYNEARKAGTASWKASFCYRRAAIGLADQYDAYVRSYGKQSVDLSNATCPDATVLACTMFRDMKIRWRRALSSEFMDVQARENGYGRDWAAFKKTLSYGRRWRIFSDHLGLSALLLVDTTDRTTYLQKQLPRPVFVAWTQLIPKVVLDIHEVVGRIQGYYDRMEDPAFFSRRLRPLKLERNYSVGNRSEYFDFSGSEGGRTPTADPSCLTQPSSAISPPRDVVDEYVNMLTDEDLVGTDGFAG
ncbi:hypothetical protein LTR22_026707 [Elasticomyces elasticus]|nr:hypothetical protein LTR22_026707 [Elasticomyces elasticus]